MTFLIIGMPFRFQGHAKNTISNLWNRTFINYFFKRLFVLTFNLFDFENNFGNTKISKLFRVKPSCTVWHMFQISEMANQPREQLDFLLLRSMNGWNKMTSQSDNWNIWPPSILDLLIDINIHVIPRIWAQI